MKKKKKVQRIKVTRKALLELLEPNAAGIDVGASEIFVAVPAQRAKESVRKFSTFTADLREAVEWMVSCGVTTAAMESTGVYWIPLYEMLEARGVRVCLVNARHVKAVPGRKSDVADCQWLQYLHSVGLLRASFRPPADICAVRALCRHRESLVRSAARQTLLMQKALDQMNLHLHRVISDITGVSGQAIIQAILAGERDPRKLAALCDRRIRASAATVAKSLEGHYRAEHLFALEHAFASYEHFVTQMGQCQDRIEQMIRAFESAPPATAAAVPKTSRQKATAGFAAQLHGVLGVDLTAVPGLDVQGALGFLCEAGNDMSRFPSGKHFASWLGLCPDNRISGGKILSVKTRCVRSRLANVLRVAASCLQRSQSELGHYYRKMRTRLGAPEAITAAAHKLARILYALITNQSAYDPLRAVKAPAKSRALSENTLRRHAAALGFDLVPAQPLAA